MKTITEFKKWLDECSISKAEKQRIKDYLDDNNIGYDMIDWKSVDRGNDFDGVKTYLKQEYGYEIPLTEREQKEVLEQHKAEVQEQLKKEEVELLNRWKKEKTEVIEIKSFETPKHLIKMACKGISNGAVIIGEGGLGKSYQTLALVKESKRDFVYLNTHITPLALYKLLFKAKDKIIILDDVKGVLDSDVSMAILKGALDDKEIRTITYETTSARLEEVPEVFEFKGQIIILSNRWKDTVDTRAIESRIKPYYLKFSYNEKIAILRHIVKKSYKKLSLEQREYCLKKLLEFTDITTKNFNFRMLINAYRFYIYDKNKFEDLLKESIEIDEDLFIVKKLMEKRELKVEKQVSIYSKITGKSRRQFFRAKKELTEKCQSVIKNKYNFLDEQIKAVGIEA